MANDIFRRNYVDIKDTYGHPIGDRVLQELSEKLRIHSRKEDLIARMGGEELIAVLPGIEEKEAAAIAEQLRRSVEQGLWEHVPITISIGVASCQPEDNIASLLSRADEALYNAKKKGRNQVSVKWCACWNRKK